MFKRITVLFLLFIPTILLSQFSQNKNDVISLTYDIYNQLDINDPLKPLSKQDVDLIISEFCKIYGYPNIDNIIDEERKKEIKDSIILILKEWNYPVWKLISREVNPIILEERGNILDKLFFSLIPEIISLKASESFQYVLYTQFVKSLLAEDEMQVLFPLTYKTIDRMDRLKVTVSPKVLSESFKTDMACLSQNFPAIFKLKKYREFVNRYPHLLIFSGASDYYKSLMNFETIDKSNNKLLYNLSLAENPLIYSNLHSSFVIFNELCKSLKNMRYEEIELLKDNLENSNRFTLLLMGVFCAKNNDVYFVTNKEIALNDRAPNVNGNYIKTKNASNVPIIVSELVQEERIFEFRNFITKFVDMYFDCLSTRDTIKYLMYNGEPVNKQIYFDKVLEFIEFGFNPKNYNSTFDYYDIETSKFIELLKYYREIDDNIKNEKYFAALMNSLYAYEDVCSIYLSADSSFEVSKNFFSTVKIVAEITSAESDEEIAKVLNKYIFSSLDAYSKKEIPFSININSYLGYYYGKEAEKVTNQWTQNRGVIAPIGLEFSLGLKNWGSFEIYIPILDMGAIMDFKLNNDSTETVPDIRFENIISPGLYLVYGIPKIPFSIGGGLQYSPQLGKITLEGRTIEPRKLRWNLFIAFDLPLLNLYKNAN